MRAFVEKVDKVRAPAPSQEVRVYRDTLAANGKNIHI